MKVRGYLKQTEAGLVVYCRRGKYKHAYKIGDHRETDLAFYKALAVGDIEWCPRVWVAQLRLPSF